MYLRRLLKHHPENSAAQRKAREYEDFFYFGWYSALTNVDPEYLISAMQKAVARR